MTLPYKLFKAHGQMEEKVDIYTPSGIPSGTTATKRQAHEKGLWHTSAHIWIYNSKGDIMLQKRSASKDTFPGLWDISVAGHISAGETPLQGALREINEEIGLDVTPDMLEYLTTIHMEYPYPACGWINREHCYVYLMKADFDPMELNLQKEEVEQARFFTPEEFAGMIKADRGKIVPHENYYDTILDAIVKKHI